MILEFLSGIACRFIGHKWNWTLADSLDLEVEVDGQFFIVPDADKQMVKICERCKYVPEEQIISLFANNYDGEDDYEDE